MRTDLDDEPEIAVDMAPLIDCVFLLLIFFLVSTTMKRIDQELKLDLPEAMAAVEVKNTDDLVTLGVDKAGGLFWGVEPITSTGLRNRLEELGRTNPDQRIRIDADEQTSYAHVLHVIDVCSFYGLDNLGLHTRRPREL
ncbi:MAG: biopolymer transporter ExbD [Kiritimatiellia bacterium]